MKDTSNPVERRTCLSEVRMVEPANGEGSGLPCIRGYGIVYNTPSVVMYTQSGEPFRETILPGAADRSVADADLMVLGHHDSACILGRRSAGTATFGADNLGVWYEATPPDTAAARAVCEHVKRREIDGSSFAFSVIDDVWDGPDEGGVYTRELRSIHVFEMGPVTFPAYRATTVSCRSVGPLRNAEPTTPVSTQLSATALELQLLLLEFA